MKTLKQIGTFLLIWIISIVICTLFGALLGEIVHLIYTPYTYILGGAAGFGAGIIMGIVAGFKLTNDILEC
jgi:hypothetical protein